MEPNKPKIKRKPKCSSISSCKKQRWLCIELTSLWRKYQCENCGGTKTIFRNLYPGYQDGD